MPRPRRNSALASWSSGNQRNRNPATDVRDGRSLPASESTKLGSVFEDQPQEYVASSRDAPDSFSASSNNAFLRSAALSVNMNADLTRLASSGGIGAESEL